MTLLSAADSKNVTAQLVVEPSSIAAGVPVTVALKLVHAPGWHTYYKEPGDSGLPTKIDWVLPEGFSAGEILWPVPNRIELPPLVNFGYEGEAALLVVLTPPSDLSGATVTLRAKVSWLECKEECVPGKAELSVVVPVATSAGAPTADMAEFFGRAREKLVQVGKTETAEVSGLLAVALAFLGGILLNVMPCVLPVLSIKVLGFVQAPREVIRRHGLLYGAGVVLSFLALAGLLMSLRAGGEKLGWGFQLQSPVFVGFLALLFLFLALNLWGVFEVGTSFIRLGGLLKETSDWNAFLSGVLAVFVATPCTAPFMGSALGVALTQPVPVALAIFASLGGGMAVPYVLLSFFPGAVRWLPKPGPWMVRLKKILSLLLFGTFIWLAWVLALQLKGEKTTTFSQANVNALLAEGRPVFVDFTAAWCITCQVNERTTLSTDKVKAAFRAHNVEVLVADWTNRDPHITTALEQFGRNGVPLYILYWPGRRPVILPTVLTPDIVVNELNKR
ncbi:MAG: thioredoxin family protein [Elusimicrobia bacterium]|nr:thioredoxin family protein [Elusimicrobiota bacterium]